MATVTGYQIQRDLVAQTLACQTPESYTRADSAVLMSSLPLFNHTTLLDVKPTKLRPYQAKGIQTLRDRVRDGKKRVLLVGPVAMGKMVLIASIIQTSSVPVLFVCHRMELIEQCVRELARLGITNVGVIRADDERTNPGATVQVASIQTLARRKKPPAGLVLIDEAHRAASDSYIDLLEHYRDAIVIGFTATPTRHDGRPLGNLFECMEIIATYQELIKDGFIVAPECYGSRDPPNLQNVRIVGGDFDEGALGEVMRQQSLIGNLVDHWFRLADKYPKPDGTPGLVTGPRRRTIVFASGIQHSLDICARFEAAGVRIAHLDGNTSEDKRREIIQALGDGTLDIISNCNVLTEGTDIPSAKCIAHARPTQSLVLWRQTSGRGMRPWHPGCLPGCMKHPSLVPLLLDHADNISRHGFPHEDLHWELHQKATRMVSKTPSKICKKCFAYVPTSRIICPYCGAEFPPAPKVESPEETQEQLVRRSTTPVDMQRAFYDNMVQLARSKGHKTGFAAAKFKDHYGAWPPWAWSEATRASFASDPEWQAALERKAARKEKEKSPDVKAEMKAQRENDERDAATEERDMQQTEDEDESFGGWLKGQGIE